MYDRNGVWQKQRVHLGRTVAGQWGLFTGGYLAWGFGSGTGKPHTDTDKPTAAQVAHVCKIANFELETA